MAITPNLLHQIVGDDDRGTDSDTSDIIGDDDNLLTNSMHCLEYHSDADPVTHNASRGHPEETLDSKEHHNIQSSSELHREETLDSEENHNIRSSSELHRDETLDSEEGQNIRSSSEASGGRPGHRGDTVEYSGGPDSKSTGSLGSPENDFRKGMISSYRTISMLKDIINNGSSHHHHHQHKLFPLRRESLVLLEEESKAVATITSNANYLQHDLKCYPKRKAMRRCKKKRYMIKHIHKNHSAHYWMMMMNLASLYKQLESLRKQLPPQAIKRTSEISPLPRDCIITNTLDYLEVLGRDIRVLKEKIKQINESVASVVKPSNLDHTTVHVTLRSSGELQLCVSCAKRRGLIGDLIFALETLGVVFDYANITSHDSFITLEALIAKDSADIIDEENIREAILRTIHSVGTD